ncbi:MAG: hypothetical protein ACRD2T_09890, partial [Thermoanaerobaculia bacterium]
KTLIIPSEQGSGARRPAGPEDIEPATESMEEEPLESLATEELGGTGGSGPLAGARTDKDLATAGTEKDSDEVFVILPEDTDTANLPVVETAVVDDQSWEGGPTTTEVLKDLPADLAAAETSTTAALEDVPLMKINPLSTAAHNTVAIADADPAAAEGVGEEEIKVIDEIADIAADLEQEDAARAPRRVQVAAPLLAPSSAIDVPTSPPAGSRRLRYVAALSSIAALILVGVFFLPELKGLYRKYIGGEVEVAGSTVGPKAHALTPPRPPVSGGAEGEVSPREELRAKIQLAMRLGLRADAGKE